MNTSNYDVTQLLADWNNGDQSAFDRLIPFVHQEIHRLAHVYMRRERQGHTLQTTALVNEVYLRLAGQEKVSWQNRVHFLAASAHVMRHILVDYAKARRRAKRGGGETPLALDEILLPAPERPIELLALDEALQRLAETDQRKSQVVELRYFGGLSIEETAEALKVSANTVVRDWNLARAWLRGELEATSNHAV